MMYLAEYLEERWIGKARLATASARYRRPMPVTPGRIRMACGSRKRWTIWMRSNGRRSEYSAWPGTTKKRPCGTKPTTSRPSTLDRLRTENRKSEADEYQLKLDQSLIRDIVVIISWTGEADLDLEVEEPSGTICSAQNRRTIGGGVLLGDGSRKLDKKSNVIGIGIVRLSEGYDGVYRALDQAACGVSWPPAR